MVPHSTNIYFESDIVTVYFELNRNNIIENLLTYNNIIEYMIVMYWQNLPERIPTAYL